MLLKQKLQQHFGFHDFREGQREIIESVLAGNDTIALLPTGTGKSLCYQLPGYIFNAPILIISPLISLMQDQVDQLLMMGEKRAVAINSFLNFEQKLYVLNHLPQYRFIFISPEMVVQEHVKERLKSMKLSLIVADEAHCISQWGLDFRPDYLRVKEILHENRPPILALTATATTEVIEDIHHYLSMQDAKRFMNSINRPNILLAKKVFQQREEKSNWLYEHVSTTEGPGIIYVSSRKKADEISQLLASRGLYIASYHGGKEATDRQFIQEQFLKDELDWIVATNAFGMGVHKNNVRQVIHETMPSNISNYMQEIGRAGRDGKQAVAILLFSDGDEQAAHFVAMEDLPNEHQIDLYEQFKVQGTSLNELVSNGYMSSTQFRVLHYWLQQFSKDKVKSMFQSIQRKKLDELTRMIQLIKSKNCMRDQILCYFEQETSNQLNCCSNCGDQYETLLKERIVEKEKLAKNWRERLKILLKSTT